MLNGTKDLRKSNVVLAFYHTQVMDIICANLLVQCIYKLFFMQNEYSWRY